MSHDNLKRGAPNRGAEGAEATPVRTVQPASTWTYHPDLPTDAQYALDGVLEPGKVLRRACTQTAWDFADEIEERWARNQSCSRRLIAERFLGCAEKVVRGYCDGDKRLPLGVLRLLPAEFVVALLRRVLKGRGIRVTLDGAP